MENKEEKKNSSYPVKSCLARTETNIYNAKTQFVHVDMISTFRRENLKT